MEQDRQVKLDKKKAKQDAIKARREEEERVRLAALEEERLANEKRAAEEKLKQEQAKKERELKKNALKKERKKLRAMCKEQNFFTESDSERVMLMAEVDRFCEIFTAPQLANLIEKLSGQGKDTILKWILESMCHSRSPEVISGTKEQDGTNSIHSSKSKLSLNFLR